MKKTYKIKIKEKILETKDSCSFVLEIPEEYKKDFLFQPGQFLTLYLNINGQKLKRSYSIPSSPLIEETFKITVKKIKNGRASSYLVDHVKKQDFLETSKPLGKFFKRPENLKPKSYVLFAAGSGITPIFSVLKSVLLLNDQNQVTLIYSNKKVSDIIYREEMKKWCKEHPKQLRVIHCLSKNAPFLKNSEAKEENLVNTKWVDRLNENFLKMFLNENIHLSDVKGLDTHYYLCGPVKYMKSIQSVLIEHGVSKNKIFKEVFSSPLSIGLNDKKEPSEVETKGEKIETVETLSQECGENKDKKDSLYLNLENKVLIGDSIKKFEEPQKIEVILNGKNLSFSYDGNESIVQALIDQGHEPPYSCLEGACMTCLGKILEGVVYQDDEGVLNEENILEREALTCQAKGASRFLKLSYDDVN